MSSMRPEGIATGIERVRNEGPPPGLIASLNSSQAPVVAGHITPDVDALGSMLALARAMPSPEARIVLPEPPSGHKLRFLLHLAGDPMRADAEQVAHADRVILLDTASPKRVNVAGKWEAIADRFVINIDHHITNTDFGRINWVVDNASSTCELVYRLIATAGWPLDSVTATLLYAGIYSDTAAFSLPNTTSDTFEAAAQLVRAGADIEQVGLQISRAQEPHEFDLIRTVYHNTRLAGGGRIAYSTLNHDEITSAGCSPEDIDDQVSIPRSLSRIRVALLFSEGERGVIRINLRGENGTPVLPLAETLGGGGHLYSAGVRMRGDMNTVVARVIAEAEKALG